jgi:TonB family protein
LRVFSCGNVIDTMTSDLLLIFFRMKFCRVLLIVISFHGLLGATDTDQQTTLATIQQAVAKTNIFELPSFAMKANIQIENRGKMIDGTYQLFWNGPDQWREEIIFAGLAEIQVGGKNTIWVSRNTDFLPLRVYNIHQALGFSPGSAGAGGLRSGSLAQFSLLPTDTIKKTYQRNDHGDKLDCAKIEDASKALTEMCVNSTGILLRGSNYSYENIQPVGSKIYPRLLSVTEEGKTVANVTITELTTPAQFPPDAFTPPKGASAQPGCMNPTLPRLVKRHNPEYPESARRQRIEGTVAIDAWIGVDGAPRVRKVVASPSPDLEKASLDAIKGWRYSPAQCSGTPVEIETILQVNYALYF